MNVAQTRAANENTVDAFIAALEEGRGRTSLNPIMRQFGSETLLTLLGFRPEILGMVNGLEPRGL